jgi:hypothetical protein
MAAASSVRLVRRARFSANFLIAGGLDVMFATLLHSLTQTHHQLVVLLRSSLNMDTHALFSST